MADELARLPRKHGAKYQRIVELIEEHGLPELAGLYARSLKGTPLWEIRIRAEGGISRAIYVVATGQRLIVLRAFVKKTQKTPPREIALATERAKRADLI